jgi:DNA-directed RNA polymerase subunit RPC12/RpoP
MKENQLKHKDNIPPAVDQIPKLQLITTCPKCGGEISLWSEDRETVCVFCDHKVFEKEGTEH